MALPVNIDPTEPTRFSPQRSRDICSTAIALHCHQNDITRQIDITSDNSYGASSASALSTDPHMASYDCNGAVSLNSVMQSNVPTPFNGGMNKFTHLNMPGGQWEQSAKFNAQDLHASHYTNLRQQARNNWFNYSDHETGRFILGNSRTNVRTLSLLGLSNPLNIYRNFSLNSFKYEKNVSDKMSEDGKNDGGKPPVELSRTEKLKKTVKEYGSTVIVFHVTISLASLGTFYLLVSR